MHFNNYMHRDLKPENVYLEEIDKPVLGDYGFIKKAN